MVFKFTSLVIEHPIKSVQKRAYLPHQMSLVLSPFSSNKFKRKEIYTLKEESKIINSNNNFHFIPN